MATDFKKTKVQYRRRFPRRPFNRPVGFLYDGTYNVENGLEIGEGGIKVDSLRNVYIGDFVTVSFFLYEYQLVSVVAQVLYMVRGDNGKHSFGMKFTDIPFESKRMIRDFISGKSKTAINAPKTEVSV